MSKDTLENFNLKFKELEDKVSNLNKSVKGDLVVKMDEIKIKMNELKQKMEKHQKKVDENAGQIDIIILGQLNDQYDKLNKQLQEVSSLNDKK